MECGKNQRYCGEKENGARLMKVGVKGDFMEFVSLLRCFEVQLIHLRRSGIDILWK